LGTSVAVLIHSVGDIRRLPPARFRAPSHFACSRRTVTWLPAREVEYPAFVDRQHSAFNLVGQTAKIKVPLRNMAGLAKHFRYELAVIAHFDLCQ
jgi:hypothetical protein